MEFKINSSPHLRMSEITKRLFNRNFHSDVQFNVQGKIIYAHSLELMKRSVVFERQFENTMGENVIIPITDCKYESFLEFIRFIYTDECTINEDNGIAIMKLATKYKVIILENQLLRFGSSIKWQLKCFEYCIRNKYELAKNLFHILSAENYALYLKDEQFRSLHPSAIEELLNFDRIPKGVTEIQIFNAVADWIVSYCEHHKITLSEGRQRFEKLIKKIRFAAMPIEEIRECYKKYPGLLSESDRMLIASQSIFGDNSSELNLWHSKCRDEFNEPGQLRKFKSVDKFETKFTVSKVTILRGLRIGVEDRRKPIEIEISETDSKTNTTEKITFQQNVPASWVYLLLEMGDSILLKPDFEYTISTTYLEINNNEALNVRSRAEATDVIISDPDDAVIIIQASANMWEMFFKSPTD